MLRRLCANLRIPKLLTARCIPPKRNVRRQEWRSKDIFAFFVLVFLNLRLRGFDRGSCRIATSVEKGHAGPAAVFIERKMPADV